MNDVARIVLLLDDWSVAESESEAEIAIAKLVKFILKHEASLKNLKRYDARWSL